MLDEERTPTLPHNAQIRNYMVHFGLGHTGDCMKKVTLQKTVNDNIDNFPDGLSTNRNPECQGK